jgi:hypothetical protein
MVENATDYKYSSAMCHAGLVNNSLVTDYYLGLKNRQVGEKWVSDDCSYLCKGLGVKGDATLF